MLSMRTRGKNALYYIRGTVSLGDKRIRVKEFSSGTRDADAASHLMANYETKLRHQLMFGPAVLVCPVAELVHQLELPGKRQSWGLCAMGAGP